MHDDKEACACHAHGMHRGTWIGNIVGGKKERKKK